MAAAAPVFSLASIGLSAGSSIIGGMGKASADRYQASRLEQAAEYGETQAAQTAAQDTENLNLRLDNIDAVRAAQNIDPDSPTTEAIRSRTSFLANRQMQTQVGNILAQANEDRRGAAYLNDAAGFAQTMGILGGGATLLKGLGQTNFGTFGFG